MWGKGGVWRKVRPVQIAWRLGQGSAGICVALSNYQYSTVGRGLAISGEG